MDSQNMPVLGKSDHSLEALADTLQYKAWLEAGWPRDVMLGLQKDAWQGVQFTVETISRSLLGTEPAHIGVLRLNLDGFLGSYEEHVGTSEQLAAMDDARWFAALKQWCDSYFPPATIEANIVQTLRVLQSDHNFVNFVGITSRVFAWQVALQDRLDRMLVVAGFEEGSASRRFLDRISEMMTDFQGVKLA